MRSQRLIYFLIISLFFTGCNSSKKDIEDTEKEIFYELIPELVDKFCLRLPPPDFNIKNGHLTDESQFRKLADSQKNRIKTIAISDSVYNLDKQEIAVIKSRINFEIQPKDYDKKIILDLENIKFGHSIKLIDGSEIIKARQQIFEGKDWDEIPSLKNLNCSLLFTRIILNNENNRGFFSFSVGCGKHCGSGFNVWIKKENGKWFIEKQESTWVS